MNTKKIQLDNYIKKRKQMLNEKSETHEYSLGLVIDRNNGYHVDFRLFGAMKSKGYKHKDITRAYLGTTMTEDIDGFLCFIEHVQPHVVRWDIGNLTIAITALLEKLQYTYYERTDFQPECYTLDKA